MYVSGKVTDLRLLPRTSRETPEVTELIPALDLSLIERIEVRNSDKSNAVIAVQKWIFTLRR